MEKYLNCAIKVFKATSNVYMTIEVFKALRKKMSEKGDSYTPLSLRNVLLRFAEYAAEHGRKDLAMENYQQAYDFIDQIYQVQ